MTKDQRVALIAAWRTELVAARTARRAGDPDGAWKRLERAHVVSQPIARLHVRTHVAMLAQGCRERSLREIVGQLGRLVVAGPASLLGRYPVGNSGRATVSAFAPMPIPDDLVAALSGLKRGVSPKVRGPRSVDAGVRGDDGMR